MGGTACNGGNRHAASRMSGESGEPDLARPLHSQAENALPATVAGFATGEGRGGGGNVHTTIATSSPKVFVGSTEAFIEMRRKRLRTNIVMQSFRSLELIGETKHARELICCGRYFRQGITPCETVKFVPLRCNSLFCPECCRLKSLEVRDRLWSVIETRSLKMVYSLTLTRSPIEHLSDEQTHAFSKQLADLRETDCWKRLVAGGIRNVEVTYHKGRGWHLHSHQLIELRERPSREWLRELKSEWERISGGKYVRIERAYRVNRSGKKIRSISRKSVGEFTKYAGKVSDFAKIPELVKEFYSSFQSLRRLQTFGEWHRKSEESEKVAEQESICFCGCECGKCKWDDVHFEENVHITDTKIDADGERRWRWQTDLGPPTVEWRTYNQLKAFLGKEAA